MAGVSLAEGRSGRRSLDFDIPMVPMIDLLLVTISFLLLTAVWTRQMRIAADAQAPGTVAPTTAPDPPRLHVDLTDPQRFTLRWRIGQTELRARDVPRHDVIATDHGVRVVRFPDLAAALAEERKNPEVPTGARADADELVLHVANDAPYAVMIGALDASYEVKRACGAATCPAYHVTFAGR